MAIGDYSNFGGYVNNEIKPNHDGDRPLGKAVSEAAHERNAARKAESAEPAPEEVVLDAEAPADVQQDKAIIEATVVESSFSAGREPLTLVYSAAIANINEILEPSLGPQAIEAAYESGLDVSPEATAERIVSLTTGMFARYMDANPDLSGAELVDRFVDVIGGGILQGFEEARGILDDMGVLEGDIASNIDRTYELVLAGLEKFRVDNGGTPTSEPAETTTPEGSTPDEGQLSSQ